MAYSRRLSSTVALFALVACRTPQLPLDQRDCSPGAEVTCDARIRQYCYGCNPLDERLRTRMATACLPQFVRTEVSECANGGIDLSIHDKASAKASVKGCVDNVQRLDPDVKTALIRMVDAALTGDKQYEAWLACYDCHLRGTCGPTIVLMDAHTLPDPNREGINDQVYCEDTRLNGGSNADDIMAILDDLRPHPDFRPVSVFLGWRDDLRVVHMEPALVIVHASAFYKKSVELESDARLLDFLRYLRDRNVNVLVYSRGVDGETPESVKKRWELLKREIDSLKLSGKVDLFVMPKGHKDCFRDPATAPTFKLKVMSMLP